MICSICQQEFSERSLLHKHLKVHKMLVSEYWQKTYPRHDKFSGELIKWHSLEQYLKDDFNNRNNFKKWLEKTPIDVSREYCRNLLIRRREEKGLVWAPTQVELRTIMFPPIWWYDMAFGDYYQLCEELGFKNKFKRFVQWYKSINLDKRRKIYVDTREQKELVLNSVKTVNKKLDFGDYAFSDAKWSGNIVIERKGLADMISTISGGYERFQREIDRSVVDGAYLIVIVEELLSKARVFNYLPYLSKKIKATPEFIFHRIRELLQKYSNLQFIFVRDHDEAGKATEHLFKVGEEAKQYDLQLLIDLGSFYEKETL